MHEFLKAVEGLGLREAAMAAHQTAMAELAVRERELDEQERRDYADRLWGLIENNLGLHSTQEPDLDGVVVLDGLRLRLSERGRLVLVLPCARCQREVESAPVFGLPDLGRLLADRDWARCWSANDCAEPVFAAAKERVRRERAVESQLIGAFEAFLDRWLTQRIIAAEE